MKHQTKWLAVALVVAGGLALTSPARAQYTTNVITEFHNFNLTATYANWNVDGSDPLNGGSGFTPVITSGATSYGVKAQAYGSGVYDLPSVFSAPGATMVELTFTLNSQSATTWMGPNFDLHDGTHQVTYLNYGNYSGPGTYTLVAPIGDIDTTQITAFNLQFDPAGYGNNTPYDLTYTKLALLTPVPEPVTAALLGLGGLGLVFARRRTRG